MPERGLGFLFLLGHSFSPFIVNWLFDALSHPSIHTVASVRRLLSIPRSYNTLGIPDLRLRLHPYQNVQVGPGQGAPVLGSSPGWIRGYPQEDGIGERIVKRRKRQRLDLTGLCGKPVKFVTPNLL